MKETETDKKTAKNADEMIMRDKEAAAESDMKTEERDRQTVTVTVTEAAAAAAAVTETDAEMKKAADSEFRKNIRLLAAIQMMLRVLLISQTNLLCFHADQSSVRQSTFLSHDDICYYTC